MENYFKKIPESPSPKLCSMETPFKTMESQLDRLTDIINNFKSELDKFSFSGDQNVNFYDSLNETNELQEIASQFSLETNDFPPNFDEDSEENVLNGHHKKRSSIAEGLLDLKDKILISESRIESLINKLNCLEKEKEGSLLENYCQCSKNLQFSLSNSKKNVTLEEYPEFLSALFKENKRNFKKIRSGSMGGNLMNNGLKSIFCEEKELEKVLSQKKIEEFKQFLERNQKKYENLIENNLTLKEINQALLKENEELKEKNAVFWKENTKLIKIMKQFKIKSQEKTIKNEKLNENEEENIIKLKNNFKEKKFKDNFKENFINEKKESVEEYDDFFSFVFFSFFD